MKGERSPSRPESVFRRLLQDILSGRYPPAQSLPSERALSEELSVSRSALREALKRLAQLGLITTQHGGSSRTNDYRRTAGLDLLAALIVHAAPERSLDSWHALLELRASIGGDVARLCALRRAPEVAIKLAALAREMSTTSDPHELFDLELTFWSCMVDSADNIAYRLAFNTLLQAVPERSPAAVQLTLAELQRSGYRMPLAEAIARGDAAVAETEARDPMRRSAEVFARARTRARSRAAALESSATSTA
jgi:GntR family transcriptional regulator, transcriptional repressor for pyruvate dehydrogenase complex